MNSLAVLEEENAVDVDPVEEMRMRTWARRHYADAKDRDEKWHPIVLEEMFRKDQERGYPHSPK